MHGGLHTVGVGWEHAARRQADRHARQPPEIDWRQRDQQYAVMQLPDRVKQCSMVLDHRAGGWTAGDSIKEDQEGVSVNSFQLNQ